MHLSFFSNVTYYLLLVINYFSINELFTARNSLAGLYVGNPKRSTTQPTTERVLAAFKEITLVLIDNGTQISAHLTALSPLQQKILHLLNFPLEIYTRLLLLSDHPP